MGANADAIQRANRLAADVPRWVVQSSTTSPPSGSSSGVALGASVRTWLAVQLREAGSDTTMYRRARVTIPVWDAATTYTVSVSGNSASNSGAASKVAALTALAASITSAASGVVTATAVDTDDDGSVDTILIVGDTAANWYMDVLSASGGTGTIAGVIDASSATLRICGRPKVSGDSTSAVRPSGWIQMDTASPDFAGHLAVYDTSGCDRMHVTCTPAKHASDAAALTIRDPDVWIGPSIVES